MKIAVYPGSFDPITIGHIDIIKRASKIFDKVIVLVAKNPTKKYHNSLEDRIAMVKEAVKDFKSVEVDSDDGLTVKYAKKVGAQALIRGIRVVGDFEYEWQLASANEYIDPSIEIVFFMAHNKTSFISSSTINEMFENGIDISELVPPIVVKYYSKKK
ncbi:MAG: pantetheine-phosphate adenylyltransferase [Bacilli bacterium]|jgi:pantetheine-phosphate adenylyltransferase